MGSAFFTTKKPLRGRNGFLLNNLASPIIFPFEYTEGKDRNLLYSGTSSLFLKQLPLAAAEMF